MTAEQAPPTGETRPASPEGPTRHTWPRDHPVTVALSGFFAGLAYVCLVPGGYVALTRLVLDQDTSSSVFPFVLVLLALPLVLLVPERTRWFGRHVLLGMAVTALVVVGVSAIVLWVLISREGG